jgi:L-2-hydroxyglutarate oxidase
MKPFDYAIVGGGIVGFAAAVQVARRFPGARLLLVEKEAEIACHQTGRNSGVIHSGIYYQPGSFKARFAKAGAEAMVRFCGEEGIPYEICGKLIVATREEELPRLEELERRGRANGVPVERISAERAREIEPHVACVAALAVSSTGITDYRQVCAALRRQLEAMGGTVALGREVGGLKPSGDLLRLETREETFETRFLINCAGLHSDRLARACGATPDARIVPFRGEYYELAPAARHLVRTLIYPVPNPAFPFLGVHFTRMVDGGVHAGPNAVLALAREGYTKTRWVPRDLLETLTFGGFWRLAARYWRDGAAEIVRSFSKTAFVRSLQELVPAVRAEDLEPCAAGVRAQAMTREGKLIDDFLIVPGSRAIHVCNAPSPGATASLEIGRTLAQQVPDVAPAQVAVPSPGLRLVAGLS